MTTWRVVFVMGTDRLALVSLNDRQACEAYAAALRQTFLAPLVRQVVEEESAASLNALEDWWEHREEARDA